MFFIGAKKQKIEIFFRNDLKSLQNGPKYPKTVFKCHFGVFYGHWGLISVILTILVIFGQKIVIFPFSDINMSIFERAGVSVPTSHVSER